MFVQAMININTLGENIIGVPKMRNNFWFAIKLLFFNNRNIGLFLPNFLLFLLFIPSFLNCNIGKKRYKLIAFSARQYYLADCK